MLRRKLEINGDKWNNLENDEEQQIKDGAGEKKGGQMWRVSDGSRPERGAEEERTENMGNGEGGDGGMIRSGRISVDDV